MTTHSDQTFWDPQFETQTRAEWDQFKLPLLKQHLRYAYDRSPYYRSSFDATGVHPDQVRSLEDIRRFPFITKHTRGRDRPIHETDSAWVPHPVRLGGFESGFDASRYMPSNPSPHAAINTPLGHLAQRQSR